MQGVVVGFGEVARNGHWPGYQSNSDVRIAAVVDNSPERRALATSITGAKAFASLAEIPRDFPVDFVDICTPPAFHTEPMLESIGRGWHVLCEKPFLLDAAVIDAARHAAVAAGVALLPVHNWKYAPIIRAATKALRAGAIGTLKRVAIETSRLQAAPTADPTGTNWRCDPAIAGGGILMDHGWHSAYLALHWFEEKPTAVQATLHRPALGPVEDEADVTIDFPSGRATIALTWNGTARRNAVRLEGTAGEIVVADDTLSVHGVAPEMVTFPSALSAGSHHADWFAAMLPDVVACFRDPGRSRPLVDEAATCLAIIQEAYGRDASLVA